MGRKPAKDPGRSEDLALLRAAKLSDSTFTTFLVTPYSKLIARWAAGRGVAPTTVTTVSLVLGLVAAGLFAVGERPALAAGAIVLQLAFVADCVDGQLARYTGRITVSGAYLDALGDRLKEYAVYAGLAMGSVAGFAEPVWRLALLALAMQLFRHFVDFGFAAAATERRPVPLGSTAVVPGNAGGAAGPRPGWLHWVRRSFVLPIGERFALISVMAALTTPRWTFAALLGWGAVAATYSIAGKTRRALAWSSGAPAGREVLTWYRDDGPVVTAVIRAVGCASTINRSRFAWVVPAAVRSVESTVIVSIVWRSPPPSSEVGYLFLLVVALHYYDVVYRLRGGLPPVRRWCRCAAAGWDGRLLVVCVSAVAGVVTAAMLVAAGVLGLLFVVEIILCWRRESPGRHRRTPRSHRR